MKRSFVAVSVAALITLVPTAAMAANPPVGSTSPGSDTSTTFDEHDLQQYEAAFNVDEATAISQLNLQESLSQVGPDLTPVPGFAGAWITHSPFRVVIAYVGPVPKQATDIVGSSPLHDAVQWESSMRFSLDQLMQAQAELKKTPAFAHFDSWVDPETNKVHVGVRAGSSASRQDLPADIEPMVAFDNASASAPAVGGGRRLDGAEFCTSGFTVVSNSTGARGISTAGHCPNQLSFNGAALNFQSEKVGGSWDEQWMRNTSISWDNTVHDNLSGGTTPYYRYITSKLAYSQQYNGDFVCKTGATTGYSCGTIGNKLVCPSWLHDCTNTFIRAASTDGSYFVRPGDSGGPVFVNNTALGIVVGYYHDGFLEGDGIYMAQNYLNGIGVHVALN